MKEPRFIVGPPGTGKTSTFITGKYLELLDNFSHEKIVVLSHTNVAAKEIRDEILKLPRVKEKGLTKKSLKYKICTIHSYCQSRLVGRKEIFDYQDHLNLCAIDSLFKLQRVSAAEFDADKHKFYKYLSDAHGMGKTIQDHWRECERTSYSPYSINMIGHMKEIYDNYKETNYVCDFQDMIQDFIDKAKDPEIDALIVDEAQDSNVPQLAALNKMAINTKEGHYYFVGDADQTIFEFAGANPNYFHTLSKNAEQLEQGYRCGKTINEICKKIIAPVWKKYEYDRVWKPAEGVIGTHHYLPSLNNRSSALDILLDKIKNTNETFLFTYRGKPSDIAIKNFFRTYGIEYAYVGSEPHVSKKELRCHKLWQEFIKGTPMSLKQIKDFWTYIGSKVIVHGKGDPKCFEEWVNQDYTIDYLIVKKCLKPETRVYEDFSTIRTKTDADRILYIEKILRQGFDLDGEVRVKYASIHKVKGLTFDNVIVDLTVTRREDYFTQLRLKYVAYSRGRVDCWSIASKDKFTLGVR